MNLDNFRKREFIRREKRMKHICRQNLVKKGNLNDALHIVYVMTHTGICGGTKIILQHANLLIKAGVVSRILCKPPKSGRIKL